MILEVLVGMIASGKSTYARKRAKAGALVICHDDLTQMLHAEYRYEKELRDFYRDVMHGIAREVYGMNAGAEPERDLIIDRTHLTRESRKAWVDWAKSICAPVFAVPFPIADYEVHARRRVHADGRGRDSYTWKTVAKHHLEQAMTEPLDWKAEGFTGLINPFATQLSAAHSSTQEPTDGQPDSPTPAATGTAEPTPAAPAVHQQPGTPAAAGGGSVPPKAS